MRIFEALFKVMSTLFGLRTVENSIENPHFIFCSSFQNRRLGSINFVTESSQSTGIEMRPVIYEVRTYAHPKRKCWKAKETVPSAFSKQLPTFVGQIHSTHALEKCFEKHSERFVRPSNIRLEEHEAYLVM
jgi:hypothetical protein